METAELFPDHNGQCVRLPDKYRFACDEVAVQQSGFSLILTPIDKISDSALCRGLCNTYDIEHISDATITQVGNETDNI